MKKWIFLLALALFSVPVAALAQDEGLYDPVAPTGSAFVRFINAETPDTQQTSAIKGKKYRNLAYGEVSAYYTVPAGSADIAIGTYTTTENVEAGAFYTAVLKHDTVKVLKDQAPTNPVKAMVAFYNLSDKDNLSLKTTDGKVEVVPAAPSGQAGYREINGVEVNLSVFDGTEKLTDIGPVVLKRNEATTVTVLEKSGTFKAAAIQAKTDTTK